MDTNDILQEIHDELIAKLKVNCKAEGNARLGTEIGRDFMDYGQTLSGAFADDGTISDEEELKIREAFKAKVLKHIPSAGGTSVKIAWNGLSFFGIGWVGLKAKLREWFGLFKEG